MVDKPVMNFPGNSKFNNEKKQEPVKKVQKVISGKIKTKKKGLMKKFTETFLGDDVDNVFSYVLHDVLVPAAKSTFSDMVSGGIEMLLFGEKRGNRTSRDRGRSYVRYDKVSYRDERDDRRRAEVNRRASHNFDDIIFNIRGDAEEVLSHLVDLIDDYGMASVADLYDLTGMSTNFTDNKYGWTNLRSASVSRIRDGYVLNLPKPIAID